MSEFEVIPLDYFVAGAALVGAALMYVAHRLNQGES